MKKWSAVSIVFLVLLLDQLTKQWAIKTIGFYERVQVFPGFDWTLVYNQGAAFSILSQAGHSHPWFFIAFSLTVSLVLLYWLMKNSSAKILENLALSLLLGGALGNLIDRILHGYVTDFILIYYKTYHWPVFNLADCAICLGAFLLLLDAIKNVNASK